MKINLKSVAILLAACALSFSARAFIVFQDSFNYVNGPILTVAAPAWVPGYGNVPSGAIQITGNQVVIPGSGTADQPRAYFTNGLSYASLLNYGTSGGIYITNASAAYFPSNSTEAALYASVAVTIPASTGLGTATYFAYFTDTNYDYRCRVILTNILATGNFRVGVANASSSTTNFVQTDLLPGNTYNLVMRYVLSSGLSTVWINPTVENTTDPTITTTAGGTGQIGGGVLGSSTCGFGLRNASGLQGLTLANLVIGTTFADVVPFSAGQNPPFITLQPQDDTSAITNDVVTFSAIAGGDEPLGYQWYFISNNITIGLPAATNEVLVLSNVATTASGSYYAVVTNDTATSATTRHAALVVYSTPVAVVISDQPQSQVVNVGDTATFSVMAAGVPPPTYQWYYVTNKAAALFTNIVSGATTATLTLTNLNTNSFYTNVFVKISNRVNTTNSAAATLTVNPIQILTIAQLRTMVDGNYNPTNTTSVFTIQGTVTTWTNMTGTANTEFYMQDNTAGICVYWSGANSTNRPPAGAVVKVSGPLSSFDGLLEIEPVYSNPLHSLKVISTGGPLPIPLPLPFDPNVAGNLKAMESCYFVASNVTLAAGSTFASGVNEPITANQNAVLTDPMFSLTFTNQQGQTFIMYINSYTDIPGKAKPFGPVTIYGVLGNFSGVGFEFTPSRYADIISYIHVTNVLSNLTRPGDAPTNTYRESFLLPGGTITAYSTISDPAGGSVTLTPMTTGLPASAAWSDIVDGQTGTATFTFNPTPADSGSNYTVNLGVTSTAGSSFVNSFTIYVPATNEQGIAISEFLANPTTNTNAPNFNPLQRLVDTGAALNDQYVEIVNETSSNLLSGWTLDSGNLLSLLFDSKAGSGTTIYSSNSVVIYGGGSYQPGITTPNIVAPNGLSLPTNSSGLLVLRNNNGNIIDRVVYQPGNLITNGSLTRFPTFNGAFVPQPYVSTNLATPGVQYDGSSWAQLPQIPGAVTNIVIAPAGTNVLLNFTAAAGQTATLWNSPVVTGPYTVIYGQAFGSSAGVFTNLALAPAQFYYITSQTNY